MTFFSKELKSVYKSVYKMPRYTKPKIYKGGKDHKGRWYVYYYFEHPSELNKNNRPKMVRFNCPTFGLNRRHKSYRERLEHFTALRNSVELVLQRGFSPFDIAPEENTVFTTDKALNYVLALKEKSVSEKTYKDYEQRVNKFKEFAKKKGYLYTDVKLIKRNLCIDFLHSIIEVSSARNRNNYKGVLSLVFGVLEDEGFVEKDYFKTIKNIKSKPTAHKIFSENQAEKILIAIDNPTLLLYVKIVGLGFLRPVEVCRLQIKDIDFENKIWTINSKTKKGKRKRIPNILFEDVKVLKGKTPNAYLITNDGVSETEISAEQRRSTFSKKHRKVLNSLDIGAEYDVYSWRHYYTEKIFNELKKTKTHNKSLDILQEITGHSTRTALMKYLRSIEVVIADDYSDLL